MIRGNKKGTRKVYIHAFGNWYLIDDVKKDNGHYLCDAEHYQLYPNLSHKEWEELNSGIDRKYLTKYIKRALFGYYFHLELRNNRNESKKRYNKILKGI